MQFKLKKIKTNKEFKKILIIRTKGSTFDE